MRSSGAQYGGALAQMPRTLARISRPAVAKSSPRSSVCSGSAWGAAWGAAWDAAWGAAWGCNVSQAHMQGRACVDRLSACVCLRGARVREEMAALAGWPGAACTCSVMYSVSYTGSKSPTSMAILPTIGSAGSSARAASPPGTRRLLSARGTPIARSSHA